MMLEITQLGPHADDTFLAALKPALGSLFTRKAYYHRSQGLWLTADLRFSFMRNPIRGYWLLATAHLNNSDEDTALLKATGLSSIHFPTRRAAYDALQLALGAKESHV